MRVIGSSIRSLRSPVYGVVASLAPNNVCVKPGGKGGPHLANFTVCEDTEISRNDKSCNLQDIKPGDLVTVIFTAKPDSSIRHITKIAAGKSSTDR